MSMHRPVRTGAFLEMAGVTVAWAGLLFAVALGTLVLVSTVFGHQIGTVLRVFGVS
ncbi:hypothetical protein [Leifsonia xyli]|uniref:hypothetical protein n=1 Tax=Leifsonia xyli TaxID=1575 RepID=UPI003D66B52F